MTLGDINTKITNLTSQNTTSYPNASRLIDINIWYRKVQQHILKAQDNADFDDKNNTINFPIEYADFVANQQDYDLPSEMLQLKRVEVSYDGTNYVKATEFDVGERNRSIENQQDFNQANPFYDVQGNSIFIYPKPTTNVTDGLKVWITRPVTDFIIGELNAGTISPGFDALYHDILAYGASFEFAISKGLPVASSYKQLADEKMAMLENAYGKVLEDSNLSFNPFNNMASYK